LTPWGTTLPDVERSSQSDCETKASSEKIDVHGNILHPDPAKGTIYFHPDTAHFMEWPYIFGGRNITLQEKKPFQVQSESQVGIHNLKRAFKSGAGGNFTIQ
jgi:hypothetical protein